MFRRVPLLLVLVLLVVSSLVVDAAGPPKAFTRKLASAEKKAAGRYVPVAMEAAKGRFYGIATKAMEKALDFDPDQAQARKYLGYVKKSGEWEIDRQKAADVRRKNLLVPGVGEEARFRDTLTRLTEMVAAADRQAAADLVSVALWARKKHYDREALEVFERAAALDAENRKAWEALGYRRMDKVWEPVEPVKREAAVRSVPLVRKRVERRRFCTYGRAHFIPFDNFVSVGPFRISAKSDGSTLRLRIQHGETANEKLIRKGSQAGALLSVEGSPPVYVFADDLGRPWHVNPDVLEADLDGEILHFYDADYDGKYFEPGVDWVALEASNHAVTWVDGFVLGDRRLTLTDLDLPAGLAEFRIEPLGPSLTYMELRVYELMNRVRLHYGLHPAELEDRLSGWCRRHSNYLRMNGITGHDEDPAKPGYSPEGHKAGNASGLSFAWTGTRGFFDLLDTPLHGYDLGSPMFTKTAVGCVPGYLTLWHQQKEGVKWPERGDQLPAVFPPNMAEGIPIDWWRETPDPRAHPAPGARWGYPIRVYLPPHGASFGPYPQDVRATLVPLRGGKAVPLQIASDDGNFKLFGKYVPFLVMPKERLRPKTSYHLQLSWRHQGRTGRWDSSFTTGTQWGQARDRLE